MGQVKSGNFFNKYTSQTLAARLSMRGFKTSLLELAKMTNVNRVHEVGCGEGYLTTFLSEQGFEVSGSDLCENIIKIARQSSNDDTQFFQRDIFKLNPLHDSAPLIICCEVLEHVEDPKSALIAVSQVASPWVIFSVPREPLWRILNVLSLRYITAFGNTPGHINHWSSDSFINMIENKFEIIAVRKPLPWTMVLARRKKNLTNGEL
jgi:2-polyprenyl-3-methyl-5-hydroxy-6-metoxy-1,4-benzoquinol methylase